MMAQKHLRELLKEDQEPFLLNNYISDRRSQLKRPSPRTSLQVKKRKPILQNSNFPVNFCKNACFLSIPDTPDLRKSPLFQLASPAKSPSASPNPIFLHIPARTAALLLEAALRIQKQSSSSSKAKPQHRNNAFGFGLFGSLFKRLTQRSRNRKREIEGEEVKASVKDILRWDSSVGRRELSNGFSETTNNNISELSAVDVEFVCSCNGRPSSAVWSQSNEDKSLGMEASSSSQRDECEENGSVPKQNHNTEAECACCDNALCQSPFRFVLLRSPPTACRTPELASPASSPSRRATEDKENNGAESVNQFQSGEEAEEKEQCSPVSVLDPPFEDDDDGHDNNDEEEEEEEDGFDLESSYAIVQRAKEQLLYKLRRFEKLAELDPLELEKRMFDQEDEDDETFVEEDDCEDENNETSDKEKDFRELVAEVVCQSGLHDRGQIPEDHKRLISDLIMEEREVSSWEDREKLIRGVCERLELWKEVETNTIDMMIEQDFSREDGEWKKDVDQMREVAGELELAIFGFLVEEISEELVF